MTKPMKRTLIVLMALALLMIACGSSAPATTAPAVSTETPAPVIQNTPNPIGGFDRILVDDSKNSIVMTMPAPDGNGWLFIIGVDAYRHTDTIGTGCYKLTQPGEGEKYGTAVRTGDICQ